MTTTTTNNLQHPDWCTAGRIEQTDFPDHGITTTRCVDCGAHEARDRDGEKLVAPGLTGALVGRGRTDMDLDVRRAAPGDIPGVTR